MKRFFAAISAKYRSSSSSSNFSFLFSPLKVTGHNTRQRPVVYTHAYKLVCFYGRAGEKKNNFRVFELFFFNGFKKGNWCRSRHTRAPTILIDPLERYPSSVVGCHKEERLRVFWQNSCCGSSDGPFGFFGRGVVAVCRTQGRFFGLGFVCIFYFYYWTNRRIVRWPAEPIQVAWSQKRQPWPA